MKGFTKFLVFFILALTVLYFISRQYKKPQSGGEQKTFVNDTSQLIIPIEIDIASFEPLFNRQLDEKGWLLEKSNVKVNKQLSISYGVKKDGKAQLYPQHGDIQLQVPLFIAIQPKIKGPLSLGLGKNMILQSRVLLDAAISTEIDDQWNLLTEVETTFEILESPQLNIAGIKIDFEEQLFNSLEIGIEEINEQIERQVKEAINTKEIVKTIWSELKTPYKIDADPFTAWAMIQPNSVQSTALTPSAPGVMQTIFKVNSFIDIETGERPIRVNEKSLLRGEIVKNIDQEYSLLHIPLRVDFHTFVEALNHTAPFNIPIQGDRRAILSRFRAKNIAGNMQLTANFSSGNATGEITLIGIPVFEQDSQTIGVRIQSVHSKSNNKMIDGLIKSFANSASGRKQLEKKMRFSLEQTLADFTFELTNQLKGTRFNEYASLNAYVNYLKINEVFVEKDALVLATEIEAKTICEVRGN